MKLKISNYDKCLVQNKNCNLTSQIGYFVSSLDMNYVSEQVIIKLITVSLSILLRMGGLEIYW